MKKNIAIIFNTSLCIYGTGTVGIKKEKKPISKFKN